MIPKLFSKTMLLLVMLLGLCTGLKAQTTLLQYNFNNNLNPTVAGPSVTKLEYYTGNPKASGTPAYNNGWLRVPQNKNGDYLELTTNTTGIQNMALSFDARLSALGLTAHWIVEANVGTGNAFVELGRISLFSIIWIPFNDNFNINLPSSAEGKSNLVIRIRTDFDGAALGNLDMDNLKITYGNPKIQVYTNGNSTVTPNVPADVHIPHLSAAAVNLDTDFGTTMTTGPTVTHGFRVRNLKGTTGSKLKIDSILVKGANPLDFSVSPNSLSDIGASASSTSSPYKTFNISFLPQADGLRSAQVYLYSNAYGSDSANPYIINVVGVGASCNLQTTSYVINKMDTGQQSLVSNYAPTDLIGGHADNTSPSKLNTLNTKLYPSANLYTSASTSWYVSNTTKTVTFGPLDISAQKNVQIRFRVAAFTTTDKPYHWWNNPNTLDDPENGLNNASTITLAVKKPDNSWFDEMELKGSNRSDRYYRYDFNGGNTFTKTYTGAGLMSVSNTNSLQYKTFVLTLPASANISNLEFRIKAKTDADNRLWLIDDVEVLTSNSVYKTFTTGNAWSPSAPTEYEKAIIEGDYTNTGNPNVCECEVMPGGKVTIPANTSITVRGKVINHGNGTNFIVKNNGSLNQIEDDAINTGNITVEKEFNFSAERKQYNYVISPVVGQSIKSIYTGAPFVIYHREDKNFFYNAGNGDYDINNPAKGFAIKEAAGSGATTQTGIYKGTPFNGVATYTLKYTPNPSDPVFLPGYNLIGNPYPSNLDIEALYDNNPNRIEPTFEFWDNRNNTQYSQQGSGYAGNSYAKYNAQSGTGVDPGTASGASPARTPNRYVKVGTAFMVRALPTANNQTLIFKNADRSVNNSGPSFFGRSEVKKDRYWLNFYTPKDLSLSTAIVYSERTKPEFWLDDSEYADASDEIYSMVEDHRLAIQGRGNFNDTDVVPLGVTAFEDGEYSIGVETAEGSFEEGQHIYLKDLQTGILTDLTLGQYTFNLNKGITEGRFEIVYKPEATLGNSESIKPKLEIYRDGQDFVVRSSEILKKIEVYDVAGRLINTATPNQTLYRIPGYLLSNGMYILKVDQKIGTTIRKVIK